MICICYLAKLTKTTGQQSAMITRLMTDAVTEVGHTLKCIGVQTTAENKTLYFHSNLNLETIYHHTVQLYLEH